MIENFKVLKRKVKYARIEIKDGEIFVIVPEFSNLKATEILKNKKNWLETKLRHYQQILALSNNLKPVFQKDFENLVLNYVKEFCEILKVKPKKISFRSMKNKWGSCDSDGNLRFNKKLKFLPEELIKYVVCHEMCHLLIKNHKKEFWLLLSKFFPDLKEVNEKLAGYKILLKNTKID